MGPKPKDKYPYKTQKRKHREKREENIFEDIITEKFPNLKENRHLTKGSTERHRKD